MTAQDKLGCLLLIAFNFTRVFPPLFEDSIEKEEEEKEEEEKEDCCELISIDSLGGSVFVVNLRFKLGVGVGVFSKGCIEY